MKILNMSITAGWIVLAVLLLRLVLKRAPRAILCSLWALVGIRLIFPFSIESALSLIPSAETVPEEILFAREPFIESGIGVVNEIVNPVLSSSFAPNVGDSVNPLQIFIALAAVLWVVGMVVLAAYAAVSYIRLRRKVYAAMRIEEKIWICDDVKSPFILGIFRPRIYLPSDFAQNQMEYVIAHEMAHLKRRDHWWKPLGYLLVTVYWFNPLIWVAYILLCRDIELACDERVIREMGDDSRKDYAEMLLFCSTPRHMISACPLAFGEIGVKERVKSVLNYKKPGFWIGAVAAASCIVAAVCLLTNPVTTPENKADGQQANNQQVMAEVEKQQQAMAEVEKQQQIMEEVEKQQQVMEVDVEDVIAGLFETIESSPLESSNPADYIAAHPIEYRELLYYGDATVEYCMSYLQEEISEGETINLRMRLALCVLEALTDQVVHVYTVKDGVRIVTN